jgi:NAD(P)-dependent dehydrogenase (short-subunit alcohol dehydrogenase family)
VRAILPGMSATRIFTKIDKGDSIPDAYQPGIARFFASNSPTGSDPAVTADVIDRAVIDPDPTAVRYYSAPDSASIPRGKQILGPHPPSSNKIGDHDMTQATTQTQQPGPKTALITGGGTGIGRAAALALAAEGYEVTVAGRTATTLEQTVKLVTHAGGNAKCVIADVHDEEAVRRAVEVAAGETGRLDVAVNSAGVDGGNDSHPLIDYPVETLELMLATNVRGMFLSMKYELEIMSKQGFGSIVNISSGAGLTGVPGYSGYVASKHAEIGLTKSAALDYADSGVRVNAVCPGLVNTPLIADMMTENPSMHEHLVASHPLGRIAEPEEVADAIVWLATSKSSYVTGVALPVDGGYLAA